MKYIQLVVIHVCVLLLALSCHATEEGRRVSDRKHVGRILFDEPVDEPIEEPPEVEEPPEEPLEEPIGEPPEDVLGEPPEDDPVDSEEPVTEAPITDSLGGSGLEGEEPEGSLVAPSMSPSEGDISIPSGDGEEVPTVIQLPAGEGEESSSPSASALSGLGDEISSVPSAEAPVAAPIFGEEPPISEGGFILESGEPSIETAPSPVAPIAPIAPTIPTVPTAPVVPGGALTPSYAPTYLEEPTAPTTFAPVVSPTGDGGGAGYPAAVPTFNFVITPEPSVHYVSVDDDIIEREKEEEKEEGGGTDWDSQENETLEEMMHDNNVIEVVGIAIGVTFGVGLLLAVCVAHQVQNNPDGCCASVCRLSVTVCCCFVKVICFPCRMICGAGQPAHNRMMSDSNTFTHDLELS